jgi:hypothetical protein
MAVHNRVESLKSKHAALDLAIENETKRPLPDSDQIRVLKWQKLKIKDELTIIGSKVSH